MDLLTYSLIIATIALGISLRYNMFLYRKLEKRRHDFLINKGFVDNLNLGFYLWDAVMRLERISLNLGKREVFFSFDKFANQFIDGQHLIENLAKAKSENYHFKMVISTKDTMMRFRCYGGSIVNERGAVIGVVMFFEESIKETVTPSEVVSQTKSDTSARKSPNDLAEIAPYLIWIRDSNLVIQYRNKIAMDVDVPYNERIVAQQALVTQKIQSDRLNFFFDGKRRPFQVTEVPFKGGVVGYAHNTETLALTESKLNNFTKSRNAVLQVLSTAVTIYSGSNKLIFFNPAFNRLFGFQKEWLETKPSYHEVSSMLNKKLIVINRDANLNNILVPQSRIISLIDQRNIHVNIIPCEHGETVITYEEIKSMNKPERIPQFAISTAFAVFRNNGEIASWSTEFPAIFGIDPQFLDTHPDIASIMDAALNNIDNSNWDVIREKMIALLVHDHDDFLKMETNSYGKIVCRACPLSNTNILLIFTYDLK